MTSLRILVVDDQIFNGSESMTRVSSARRHELRIRPSHATLRNQNECFTRLTPEQRAI